jgi:hypothetical protein
VEGEDGTLLKENSGTEAVMGVRVGDRSFSVGVAGTSYGYGLAKVVSVHIEASRLPSQEKGFFVPLCGS